MRGVELKRTFGEPSRSAMKRHALQTGQVTWAWNLLQGGFFHIFSSLVSPSNHGLALAIWHSHQGDKAQREMTLAAAQAILLPDSRLLANIKWVKERADDLSYFRNDAAHVLITMGLNDEMRFQVWPDPNTTKPAAVARLLARPVSSYWEKVRGDMFVLGVYAAAHADQIRANSSKFPRRPRLLSIKNKRGQSAKRKSSRKASQHSSTQRA